MASCEPARDIGNGLVCASFGPDGQWLSLATIDPERGFVELTGMPPFDEAHRGDPEAVRRYRSGMRQTEHAFLSVDAGLATVTAMQGAPEGTRGVGQRLVVIAGRPASGPATVRLGFRGRLARPAYAEITEVDPPRWEAAPTRLMVREGSLVVLGEGPPVVVDVRLGPSAEGPSAQGLAAQRSAAVPWRLLPGPGPRAEAVVEWPAAADELRLDITCAFELPTPPGAIWTEGGSRSVAPTGRTNPAGRLTLRVPARLSGSARCIRERALDYVRGCTALRAAAGERCILADHRILPLSWARDAFWQARLLLGAWSSGDGPGDVEIVADHLRWLFIRCERRDGRWVRSHYADGTRKDRPFQADQQLYPLLELADHIEATGSPPEHPTASAWADLVTVAWAAAMVAVDARTGLIRADENPADDALGHPYLLSNQILLWWTATRLAAIADALGMPAGPFGEVAARTNAAVAESFVVAGPLGRQWAYAVDARGGSELYHDANDVPVALAPLWGFCPPDDPLWRTTMRFAFDPANPGSVAGSHGGLGSRHTPGTWTLGDIQRWVAAGLGGDQGAAAAALGRLVEVASSNDWMLPEAYDPDGSGHAVRHWFAWPGALFGAIFLEHAQVEA